MSKAETCDHSRGSQDASKTLFFFQEFAKRLANAQPQQAALPAGRSGTGSRRQKVHRLRAAAQQHTGQTDLGGLPRAASGQRLQQVTNQVAAAAAAVLGQHINEQAPLMEAGLDSLGAPQACCCRSCLLNPSRSVEQVTR